MARAAIQFRPSTSSTSPPTDALPVANASRIVKCTDLRVSLDLEGGYAVAPGEVAANVACVIETGVVGINFEDQLIGGETGYHPPETLPLKGIGEIAVYRLKM